MVKKTNYDRFVDASNVIADILINHQKNPKCVRCQKKINIPQGMIDHAIIGRKISKKSKEPDHFASLPFSFMSGEFTDTPYHLLCYDCTDFIKRTIGIIPERYSTEYFPAIFITLDDKQKKTIYYKNETIPYGKHIFEELMDEAVKNYLQEFPECPHDYLTLHNLLKSKELYKRKYGDM